MKNIKTSIRILILVTPMSLALISCNKEKTVENIQVEKPVSEERFGLSEDQRKELFKEIVRAEDKAGIYQRKKEDSILNLKLDKSEIKKEYDLIKVQSDKLMKKYKEEVLKEYSISEEQEKQIGFEGLEKNWSLE